MVRAAFIYEFLFIEACYRFALGGIGRVSGTLVTVAGVLLSLPAVILSIPAALIRARNPNNRIGMGTGIYLGFVGVLGLPGAIVASIGSFMNSAGEHAMKDPQTVQYKDILKVLITILGGNYSDVVDEVAPLEDHFISEFSAKFPGCDLSTCSRYNLDKAISSALVQKTIPLSLFSGAIKKVPVILPKMRIIGRVRAMRRLLQSSIMIAFIGSDSSGKSTTIQRLFDLHTEHSAALRESSLDPIPYPIGQWTEALARSGEYSEFSQWLSFGNRCSLQVHAVDFPGISSPLIAGIDGGLVSNKKGDPLALSKSAACLASVFVVLLVAGSHPSVSDKEIVDIAKENRKPFIVVLNKCDIIEHELRIPGRYEDLIESYSRALDVPKNIIHFMSSTDNFSNDKLRGLLFGMIQNIVGDDELNLILALRFLPHHVLEKLLSEPDLHILSSPQVLSMAVSSLMFNLCPMTAGTLADMYSVLLSDLRTAVIAKRTPGVDIKNVYIPATDQIRQLAGTLHIDDNTYSLFIELFQLRILSFKGDFEAYSHLSGTQIPLELKRKVESVLATTAMAALRQQLNQYFGNGSIFFQKDIVAMSADVLLGLQSFVALWVDRGYSFEVVAEALKEVFSSPEPLTDAGFLVAVVKVQARPHPVVQSTEIVRQEHKSEFEDRGIFQFNRKLISQDHVIQLEKAILFQPFPEFSIEVPVERDEDTETSIRQFRESLKSVVDARKMVIRLRLSDSSSVLDELLQQLMALNVSQIQTHQFSFEIMSESAVDVNGVTRSVLSKAAQEIISNPEKVKMRKDEDSGLIYFDPDVCAESLENPTLNDEIHLIFRAFGRLIGLCLVKSNDGITFPVNFPVTFYRLLLGNKIGIADLSIIYPQVANSVHNICLLESDILNESDLYFSISIGKGHKDCDLVPNGGSKLVTQHNRLDYVREIVKYYLCCKEDVIREGNAIETRRNLNPLRHVLLGMLQFNNA